VLPGVRAFPGGAAPKPVHLHGAMKETFGGTGIVSGYGLTEAPILAMGQIGDPDAKLAVTEGRPSPGVDLRIVGPDGAEQPTGVEGEIQVRGPMVCLGYVDPALTAAAFDAEGFFATGDLGRVDADGYVTVSGRLKDIIIRKGENISAKEVEDLLFEHPDIDDVSVIGLPDAERGERCCAVVVARPGAAALTLDAVAEHLRARELMAQKIPEQLELTDSLPRNPAGKVLKHELRRRFGAGS
jgi:acyl-CoA synthetase (AMP-forming)/AMP-acid ligase II